MTANSKASKILIADIDSVMNRKLKDFLEARGFVCKVTTRGSDAIEAIEVWKPQFIIYDMLLPEVNALTLLERIKQHRIQLQPNTAIFVVSAHNSQSNVKASLLAGASDFIVKPCSPEDILSRIAFHSQKRKDIQEISMNAPPTDRGEYFLYLTEMVLRKMSMATFSNNDLLFDLVQMQAIALSAIRCSLIETDFEQMKGVVVKSSDDRSFSGFEINLRKYPEVTTVLNTRKLVAIDNLSSNAVMCKIKTEFKEINFNSMVVCPVWAGERIYGVLSARMAAGSEALTDNDIRYAQIMAHLIGLQVGANEGLFSQSA